MSSAVITDLGDKAGDPEGRAGCCGHRERWRSARSEVALVRTRNEQQHRRPSVGKQANSDEEVGTHAPT